MFLKANLRLFKQQFISQIPIKILLFHQIMSQNSTLPYHTGRPLSTQKIPPENATWIQEISDLMTDLYTLLEKMRYLKPNSIAYPPHTSPQINTSLTTTLGLSPSVTELLQRLPYVQCTPGPAIDRWTGEGLPSATIWSGYGTQGHFLLAATFADMRVDDVLRTCRSVWGEDPIVVGDYEDFERRRDIYDEEHGSMFLKDHQVALTGYSFIGSPPVNDFYPRGGLLILDMETRRLHTVGHGAEQYHEYDDGSFEDCGSVDPVTKNQIAPGEVFSNERENRDRIELYASRPATEALRDYISRFQSLEWVPGFVDGSGMYGYKRDAYKSLYISAGWPQNFDGDVFETARKNWDSTFAAYKLATQPLRDHDEAVWAIKREKESIAEFEQELEEAEAYEANPDGRKTCRPSVGLLTGLRNRLGALSKHEKKLADAKEKMEFVDPLMRKQYYDFLERYKETGHR